MLIKHKLDFGKNEGIIMLPIQSRISKRSLELCRCPRASRCGPKQDCGTCRQEDTYFGRHVKGTTTHWFFWVNENNSNSTHLHISQWFQKYEWVYIYKKLCPISYCQVNHAKYWIYWVSIQGYWTDFAIIYSLTKRASNSRLWYFPHSKRSSPMQNQQN